MKLTKTQIIKEFPKLKHVIKGILREIKDYNDLFGLISSRAEQWVLLEMIQKKKITCKYNGNMYVNGDRVKKNWTEKNINTYDNTVKYTEYQDDKIVNIKIYNNNEVLLEESRYNYDDYKYAGDEKITVINYYNNGGIKSEKKYTGCCLQSEKYYNIDGAEDKEKKDQIEKDRESCGKEYGLLKYKGD